MSLATAGEKLPPVRAITKGPKHKINHPLVSPDGSRFIFLSPPGCKGEWRCDPHPRYGRDGRKVTIDSPHGGNGRRSYLIGIASIVS